MMSRAVPSSPRTTGATIALFDRLSLVGVRPALVVCWWGSDGELLVEIFATRLTSLVSRRIQCHRIGMGSHRDKCLAACSVRDSLAPTAESGRAWRNLTQ